MNENIKIPLQLLSQTISLLEYLDVSAYDPVIQHDFHCVYSAFLKKRESIELRKAYSQIVFARDEDSRFNARMRYLQRKRLTDKL